MRDRTRSNEQEGRCSLDQQPTGSFAQTQKTETAAPRFLQKAKQKNFKTKQDLKDAGSFHEILKQPVRESPR